MHRHKDTASVLLLKEYAPFFVKNPNGLRQDHCNYLVVYEQINAFFFSDQISKSNARLPPRFGEKIDPKKKFALRAKITPILLFSLH